MIYVYCTWRCAFIIIFLVSRIKSALANGNSISEFTKCGQRQTTEEKTTNNISAVNEKIVNALFALLSSKYKCFYEFFVNRNEVRENEYRRVSACERETNSIIWCKPINVKRKFNEKLLFILWDFSSSVFFLLRSHIVIRSMLVGFAARQKLFVIASFY